MGALINVLVVGGGGREHALVWKIDQSPMVRKIYCAPGNAGTLEFAENVDIGAEDVEKFLNFAKSNDIGLTVVGPEAALCEGIVDAFSEAGLKAFGPDKKAALLEGSKAFMKRMLKSAGIPTAKYEKLNDRDSALKALEKFNGKVAVKADGLAAGKGVVICQSTDEAVEAIDLMMVKRAFGAAGDSIIIEELLEGQEASMLAFCDGENFTMMPSSQDHKRIGDGDTGPNTGGMGAYSPACVVTPQIESMVEKDVMAKIMAAMKKDGRPYKGILYAGLMLTDDGPKVLEFNCRFGDPECQPILMRLESDIVPLLLASVDGNLKDVTAKWSSRSTVCVVMASGGYPGPYEKGKEIHGLKEAALVNNVVVFHAGTTLDNDRVLTSGGRVLGVTASGSTVGEAIDTAYEAVSKISWDGAVYRKDIGHRAIGR
ncbi:Phosphoribosylamine--glycine ligase [hydrothermal vent metagenome]|uniref:phosphoribosylamine--glycine ligase n=1 Tax=hydrothermal vent metagenome TaxID=652676 RepID=A0A3B1BI83_9ZZZZ